jgi:hypothetical protein
MAKKITPTRIITGPRQPLTNVQKSPRQSQSNHAPKTSRAIPIIILDAVFVAWAIPFSFFFCHFLPSFSFFLYIFILIRLLLQKCDWPSTVLRVYHFYYQIST